MSREEQGIDVFAILDDPVDPGFVEYDIKAEPLPDERDAPRDEAPPRATHGHTFSGYGPPKGPRY